MDKKCNANDIDTTLTSKNDIHDGFFEKIIRGKEDGPEKVFGNKYRIFYPPYIRKSVTAFVPDSDLWYKMTTYPRGRMLIINMKHFHPSTGLQNNTREGTGVDVEALVRLFLKLGYIIEVYDDLKKSELLKVMIKASRESYKNYSAFVCAILTHGAEKLVYATDDSIEIRKLTRMFNGQNLAGIPKIFLIQACQGTEFMTSIDECDGPTEENKFSLPAEADFLYAYSTVPGYYSWRHKKDGSWFIQTLCRVFREYAKDFDIMRMLTKVNEIVAKRKSQTNEIESCDMRQIASVVSQLRKEFYFFPPS